MESQQTNELAQLRQRVAELESVVADYKNLEEVQRRFEFMANTSKDFMTLINRERIYEAVNQAYCLAHQLSVEEIVGKTVPEVWGAERYEAQIKDYLDTCFTGKESHYEGWFHFATLGRRYFNVSYYPYLDNSGTVTHAVVISRDSTRYKQIEERLSRSEQRYRLTSDLTSNFTYAFGLSQSGEFLLEWVTDAFERITGFSAEEVGSRSQWLQMTHPEDIFQLDRREQALQAGHMNVSEYRIVTKSGNVCWVRDYIRPIWSRKQKQVVRMYGAVQDITARKQAEAERERFTGMLRTATDISRRITSVLDFQTLLPEIVALVQNRFDVYQVNIYLLNDDDNLVIEAGAGVNNNSMPEKFKEIDSKHPHNPVTRAARTQKTVLINDVESDPTFVHHPLLPLTRAQVCIPLTENNRVLGILDVQDSRTDRFQPVDLDTLNILAAQIAVVIRNARLVDLLRISEERYALAAHVGKVGVWDYDIETAQFYLAPNLKAVLGYSDREIESWDDVRKKIIHPDDLAAIRTIMKAHLEGLTPEFAMEFRMLHKDGSTRWMLARGVAFRSETNSPVRVTGAITNITELKRIEQALQYRVALETFVTTMSTRFINISAEDIDQEINNALGIIGQFIEANCACIALANHENHLSVKYHWHAKETPISMTSANVLPLDQLSWLSDRLYRLETVYIPHIDRLPPEAQPEKEYFSRHQFQSLIAVLMTFSETTTGILVFGNISQERTWTNDTIEPLKLVRQMFINTLERKRVEEQIQQSLQEKNILLQEVHHRVKNNLQIISSLLYLQSTYTSSPDTETILLDSQNRIYSMGLIHENLYQTKQLSNLNMARYIRNLLDYLMQSYATSPGYVRLETNLQQISFDVSTAIPCGLLITELVSNSLKHAFPQEHRWPEEHQHQLWVRLQQHTETEIKLEIEDNGIGLPVAAHLKQSQTLGFKLIDRLVSQLKGTLTFDRNEGTLVRIIFPYE